MCAVSFIHSVPRGYKGRSMAQDCHGRYRMASRLFVSNAVGTLAWDGAARDVRRVGRLIKCW